MATRIDGPLKRQRDVCAQVLSELPAWFGIPTAVEKYVTDAETLPSFVAYTGERIIGILTFRVHFEQAAEIDVIGVRPECHRRGIGRALVAALESHLRKRGVEYLQVKTLDASAESAAYEQTRRFFSAMGFV
ncbi:MAG: GNAT family N-acetyltransferase, partial [Dehalococcoidia bacterium]|nr:GNAT family N-acetyltransferase [Dehalococcoidia bacterium]